MKILFYLRRGIDFLKGRPQPSQTIRCEEIEGVAKLGKFYVLGSLNEWGLVLVCPCGCGDLIELNLLPETRPRWSVTEHWDGTISVRPSVWRTEGCRSHFWIRQGVIQWVSN